MRALAGAREERNPDMTSYSHRHAPFHNYTNRVSRVTGMILSWASIAVIMLMLSTGCGPDDAGDDLATGSGSGETTTDGDSGGETGPEADVFRAAPVNACIDYESGTCTLDLLGGGCPATAWDACQEPWQPRACIGGGPCFVVPTGSQCPQNSWDACKN